MKKTILTSILALLISAGLTTKAQDRADDYLGLPGDNLNLYAVMNLFQESKTLEDFERDLNDQNSRINNLDLDGDGYVDYITVSDYVDGNVHTIVMQVALGPREKQDVGVFTVERFRDGSVQIQLIGDEALYGRNYIIEPNYDTPNPGYQASRYNRPNTYIEVSAWPMVRFIYDPGYVVWHSTWYWGYYPVYWHPWTPFYYHYYYGYHHHNHDFYYTYYHHASVPRYARYNDYYYNHVRSYSPTVVVNINKGHYKNTYSRPQSRKEGEALYARDHSNRSSNLSNRSARMSNERRGSEQVSRGNMDRRNTSETMSRNNNQRSQQMNRSASGQNKNASETRRTTTTSSNRNMNNVRSSTGGQRTEAVRQSSVSEKRNVAARSAESNYGNGSQARSSNQSSERRTVSATQSNSKGSSSARQSTSSTRQGTSSARQGTSSRAPERKEARSGGNSTKSSGKAAQAKSSESRSRR
jgi:hypothetical protein